MPHETPEQIAYARKIMACKDFVPLWLRFVIFTALIFVFQFTGGVYMAAVVHMAGSMSWVNSDVMMAGYTGLVGMTMLFPVQFRVMFRFENRTVLMVSLAVGIAAAIICMYCQNIVVVCIVNYIAGVFKMAGTFFCITNIQLRISATRDMAYFYPFLYTIILTCIQLTGICTGYCVWFFGDWQSMHLMVVALLAVAMLVVHVTMRRHYRMGPFLPFYALDYLGCLLWSGFLICVLFIFLYGDQYEWWTSKYIWQATWLALTFLALAIWRAATIRHPFIDLRTFVQKNFVNISILFVSYCMMNAVANDVQIFLTDRVMGADFLHTTNVNWWTIAGILCGTASSWVMLAKRHWRPKWVATLGFASFTAYVVMLYFLVDPTTELSMLRLPLWLRGFGNALLYVVLAYALARNVPFPFYFQALCAIGFIRTGVGTPVCSGILEHFLHQEQSRSFMELASNLNLDAIGHSLSALTRTLAQQSFLVAMKETYGLVALIGVATIALVLASDYRGAYKAVYPKLPELWRMVKKRQMK